MEPLLLIVFPLVLFVIPVAAGVQNASRRAKDRDVDMKSNGR
jgi:hypothetical protein